MKNLILLLAMAMLGSACGETSEPGGMAPVASATGSWARIKLESDVGFSQVAGMWTGDEVLFVSGPTVLSYRPSEKTMMVLRDVPQADECEGCGYGQAAAWTGRELVMWGGGFTYDARGGAAGVAFDPRSGELRPVPEAPIPVRWYHSAVWTGEEVIVWGGEGRVDGAAYDPVTSSWRRIPDAPIEGYAHSAVWTGEAMIVWGGSDDYEGESRKGCPATFVAAGAAYYPASDEWRTIAESPLEPRGWHSSVWTGEEMIVWGGGGGNCAEEPRSDGARYDPSTDTWRRVAEAPLSGRVEHSAVWTGEEMIVWGGSTNGRSVTFNDGAVYRPDSGFLGVAPARADRRSRASWRSVDGNRDGRLGWLLQRDSPVHRRL